MKAKINRYESIDGEEIKYAVLVETPLDMGIGWAFDSGINGPYTFDTAEEAKAHCKKNGFELEKK